MFEGKSNNEQVYMTRRYPNLRQKQLQRDSKISQKIAKAWDEEQNPKKVLDIFVKESKNLSNERYWETLRSVWVVCGKLETIPIFRKLFTSNRPKRYYFSSPEESKILAEMPDKIEVYRACDDEEDGGLSWTTSWDYVLQYRDTFSKKIILTKTIDKSKVFAFINRNKESEILIL